MGLLRGLRQEVSDMRALCREELAERRRFLRDNLREYYTSEGRNNTQEGRVYPQLPRDNDTDDQRTTYMREFFSSLVDPGIPQEVFYKLDKNTSESSDCDSGRVCINLD